MADDIIARLGMEASSVEGSNSSNLVGRIEKVPMDSGGFENTF